MKSDAQMLAMVHAGVGEAYGWLFARHQAAARRVAVRVAGPSDADDVVAESFAGVLAQIRAGRGPVTSFRAYLMTTVRHEAMRRAVVNRRSEPMCDIDPIAPVEELPDDGLRTAYGALPERWRQVLWQLEVEGIKPHELAAQLGLTPNAVSALGYRARAALREAYLAHPRWD